MLQRPRHTEQVVEERVSQWFVRSVTRVVATYAIGVGITILLGGSQRFAGLSYQVALQTPGAPASWGFSIAVIGALLLLGSLFAKARLVGLAAVGGCIWSLLFAWAFTTAAALHDSANTTAPWAYLELCAVFGLVAGVHLAMRPLSCRNTD